MWQSVNVTILTNQIAIPLLSSNAIAFGVIYSKTPSCILANLNTFTDTEDSLKVTEYVYSSSVLVVYFLYF